MDSSYHLDLILIKMSFHVSDKKKNWECFHAIQEKKETTERVWCQGQILFPVLHTNFIFPFFCPVIFLADGVDGSTGETRSRISEFSASICFSSGGRPWGKFPSKTISCWTTEAVWFGFRKGQLHSLNSELVRHERCSEDEAYCQNTSVSSGLLEMGYVK